MTTAHEMQHRREPGRLTPLLDQFDWAGRRLIDRLTGPEVDSGTGTSVPAPAITDDELRWEPVPGCWNVRRRASTAAALTGSGPWGRDTAPFPHPWPPPFTTIAWRLSHLSEMMAIRADYTVGGRSETRDSYRTDGTAAGAIAELVAAADAWRLALTAATDTDLDTVGHSTYPYGSDAEEPFLYVVWWVNQEVLHHGAEVALLRDLYRDTVQARWE